MQLEQEIECVPGHRKPIGVSCTAGPFVLKADRKRIVGIEPELIAITDDMTVDDVIGETSLGVIYGDRPESMNRRYIPLLKLDHVLMRTSKRFITAIQTGLERGDIFGESVTKAVPGFDGTAQIISFETPRMRSQEPVVDMAHCH